MLGKVSAMIIDPEQGQHLRDVLTGKLIGRLRDLKPIEKKKSPTG